MQDGPGHFQSCSEHGSGAMLECSRSFKAASGKRRVDVAAISGPAPVRIAPAAAARRCVCRPCSGCQPGVPLGRVAAGRAAAACCCLRSACVCSRWWSFGLEAPDARPRAWTAKLGNQLFPGLDRVLRGWSPATASESTGSGASAKTFPECAYEPQAAARNPVRQLSQCNNSMSRWTGLTLVKWPLPEYLRMRDQAELCIAGKASAVAS